MKTSKALSSPFDSHKVKKFSDRERAKSDLMPASKDKQQIMTTKIGVSITIIRERRGKEGNLVWEIWGANESAVSQIHFRRSRFRIQTAPAWQSF